MEPATEIIRRVSLLSLASKLGDKNKHLEEAKIKEATKGKEPPDRFYMFHILLVLVGLMQMLPVVFFVTANDYWMYKFRNTTLETVDSKHRTSLQAFFASWTSIVSSVPSVITTILTIFFGHKVRTRSRLLVTLFIILVCFVVFTGFVKINTDDWQFAFFCLSMIVIIIINSMAALFHSSSMALFSKFSPHYMQFYLYGEGCSEFFSSILQIVSLAIGPSTETAALIYFLVGTSMIALTYVLIFFSKYLALGRYYLDNTYEDTKRPVYKMSEIFGMLRQLWPFLLMTSIIGLSMVATHPNITNLVASENNGNGSLWSDKYFVPCITFLYGSICSLLGRVATTSLKIKKSTTWIWIIVTTARMVLLVPLVWLCNAQPRHHLPVVFGHDWEYIVIVGALASSAGGIFNTLLLSIKEFISGDEELAYLTMMMFMSVFGALTSPLGLLVVKIL